MPALAFLQGLRTKEDAAAFEKKQLSPDQRDLLRPVPSLRSWPRAHRINLSCDAWLLKYGQSCNAKASSRVQPSRHRKLYEWMQSATG